MTTLIIFYHNSYLLEQFSKCLIQFLSLQDFFYFNELKHNNKFKFTSEKAGQKYHRVTGTL